MINNIPESDVLKGCLEFLKLHQIFCFRNNTGSYRKGNSYIRYGMVGSSDILGILPNGQFLAVECKRGKGGKLSEEQILFLDNINRNGGVGICVNSVEALEEKLRPYLKK